MAVSNFESGCSFMNCSPKYTRKYMARKQQQRRWIEQHCAAVPPEQEHRLNLFGVECDHCYGCSEIIACEVLVCCSPYGDTADSGEIIWRCPGCGTQNRVGGVQRSAA